jgi:hypothetical protein
MNEKILGIKNAQLPLNLPKSKKKFGKSSFFRIVGGGSLTPQQALELITPQQAPATTGSISKFSYQKFEKVKIFNSRIWMIDVQGTHITKYLEI